MRYGVRSISMDDIARHLSVSKKTLYQHFADKDELVTLFSRNHIERSRNEYDALREQAQNSIEELTAISRCMKRDMEQLNPALIFDIHKFYPKAWALWLDFKNKFVRNSVIKNLEKGKADGYIRPEVDPRVMAVVRVELVQIGFSTELFPTDQFKLADVQTQIFDQFVYGIVTEKGRKLYDKYKHNQQSPDKKSTTLL